MDIKKRLTQEFALKSFQVENTINLIDDGNTIPFIARYRKELTGSLDDQVLRELCERLAYLRGLEEKRAQYRHAITEMGKMTDEVSERLNWAETLAELEDIYRPFRPKRRTRATVAREKGLEPLAAIIMKQNLKKDVYIIAEAYIDEEKGVESADEAIAGALDILAEDISDDAENRAVVRSLTVGKGFCVSKAVDPERESVYEMYYNFNDRVKSMAGHRVLALNRGEKEGFLSVSVEAPVEEIIAALGDRINKNNKYTAGYIERVIDDSYKRLIAPSIEREIRNGCTENAEEGAIRVFSENLRQLLMQSPIRDMCVLALDPGYRTGCKLAVIDGTGKVRETGVIFPTPPQSKLEASAKTVKGLIKEHGVDIIAIGNGTASRETEVFVADVIKTLDKKIHYIMVNEAGASIYSASKLAAEEFPDFDVALRSAVSIGRRLQDPLAELVKITPQSIGVGQYQHDMNQKRLSESLGGVVEDCVNQVGVDLNTASPSLLSYVSGITASVAKNILEYREENGKFSCRSELLKVKKLGPKTFEQCAGFLRVPNGKNPLDNTGVHPESYDAVEKLLKHLHISLGDIAQKHAYLSRFSGIESVAKAIDVGVPTLRDIISELEKPGRDPRDEMPKPVLREDVLSMEDLTEGMELLGTVRNIIDFGVFVDIGVHQDGLVHVSQLSDRYVKHPLEAVSVGDVIKVRVLSVNLNKKRVALSMKGFSGKTALNDKGISRT